MDQELRYLKLDPPKAHRDGRRDLTSLLSSDLHIYKIHTLTHIKITINKQKFNKSSTKRTYSERIHIMLASCLIGLLVVFGYIG